MGMHIRWCPEIVQNKINTELIKAELTLKCIYFKFEHQGNYEIHQLQK